MTVSLREADAEHLPFDDALFDTVVCALSLCTIPSPVAAIGEMRRVLGPGGRLLLLDHIGSTWPPVYAAQWLVERITIRAAGEHFTRRQLPLVTGGRIPDRGDRTAQGRHRGAHPRGQARLIRPQQWLSGAFPDASWGLPSNLLAGERGRLSNECCLARHGAFAGAQQCQ